MAIIGEFESTCTNHIQSVSLWPLLPFGVSPPDTVEVAQNNDTVYFAQLSSSQLIPGGSGFGAFDFNQTASVIFRDNSNDMLSSSMSVNTPQDSLGKVLRYAPPICENFAPVCRYPHFRYSQWGIRVHCEKLPDPTANL